VTPSSAEPPRAKRIAPQDWPDRSVPGAIFLGLDLAWSPKNPSGLAALDEGGTVLDLRCETSDADILAWVRERARATTVLGIDMPTIVKNASGARVCEAEVRARFARHHAGPHPANLGLATFRDGGRARRLLDHLAADGFADRPRLTARQPGHHALEVFPHPAHVRLFERATIFKYKKKSGREWPDVWAAWADYRASLASLGDADPPLRLPASVPHHVRGLKSAAYKGWDDLLDALTCAYVAAFAWRYGTSGPEVRVFGDADGGYIVVPDKPPLRRAPSARRDA